MCVVCAPGACQAVRSGSHLTSRALASPNPRSQYPVPSNQFPTSSSGDRAFVGWPVCFVSRVLAISNSSSRSFPAFPWISQLLPGVTPWNLRIELLSGTYHLGELIVAVRPSSLPHTYTYMYIRLGSMRYGLGYDSVAGLATTETQSYS